MPHIPHSKAWSCPQYEVRLLLEHGRNCSWMLQILNLSNWQCYRSGIIFTNQQNILHSSRTQTLQIFLIVRQHAYHAQCNNILLFLSTCPSTTCYCIQTKAHIVINFFDQLVGASYQFSQRNHHQKIPRRTPPQRGVKYKVGKICNFQSKLPFITETVRDRTMVTMDH